MKHLFQLTVEEFENLQSDIIDKKFKEYSSKNTASPITEELLKINEAADFLHVTTRTINTWKKSGRIPFHYIGSRIFYRKSELESALADSRKKR